MRGTDRLGRMWRSLATPTIAVALALLTAACASPTRPTALVAPLTAQTIVAESNPLFQRVSLGVVSGGRETGLISASQVSNEALIQAVDTSLDLALLRAPAPPPGYLLDVTLEQLEQPSLQINLTVTVTIRYSLRRLDGAVVYEERVTTPFTAPVTDSIIRSERFRLATEGAVKSNIATFLSRLVSFSQANAYALL